MEEYRRKREALARALAEARSEGALPVLGKATSNLFRVRDRSRTRKLDVRHWQRVLAVDVARLTADVEGMATYESLVEETLRHGLLPAVTPQLKTITVGGAVSGLGIESSSFRAGLAHETVEEMDVMLGSGDVVTCSPLREPDLFYGFANSYGTLGYALRLRVRLIPTQRYVRLTHRRFTDGGGYFSWLERAVLGGVQDFLDGTVFDGTEMYATEGNFSADAPFVSDYTYRAIYYRSIARRTQDWLTAKDYIWRWDTDWFWCSRRFGVQNLVLRLLATPWLLNSRTYQRLMRLAQRVVPESGRTESVIQDVDIPIGNAAEFLDFLLTRVGIVPVWICPFRHVGRVPYDLYALEPGRVYVNFGFWDTVPAPATGPCLNRVVEEKTSEMGGKKALYSTVCYDEDTFWTIYGGPRYAELKRKYDPGGVFPNLYEKCVRRR